MPIEIFRFVQARALMKTAKWMGLSFNKIENLLKDYYKGTIDFNKIDKEKGKTQWEVNLDLLTIYYEKC